MITKYLHFLFLGSFGVPVGGLRSTPLWSNVSKTFKSIVGDVTKPKAASQRDRTGAWHQSRQLGGLRSMPLRSNVAKPFVSILGEVTEPKAASQRNRKGVWHQSRHLGGLRSHQSGGQSWHNANFLIGQGK